jgi:type VI secretion system protein ImpB
MPQESVHKKLARVRKPRVHITYDVHVGDAREVRELPFVVGVLADLSGQPKDPKLVPKVKDRKFVEIDRDSFNDVLRKTKPRLAFRVPNRLKDDDSTLGVELQFGHMDDFRPDNVARQVEPLRKLVEARQKLNELAIRVKSSDDLEDLLQKVLQSTEALQNAADASPRKADAAPETPGEETKNG